MTITSCISAAVIEQLVCCQLDIFKFFLFFVWFFGVGLWGVVCLFWGFLLVCF